MAKDKIKDVLIGILQNYAPTKEADDSSGVKIKGKKSGVKKIHVSEIREPKEIKIRENLLEWKNNDFSMYFIESFRKKIFPDWDANRIGITIYMGRIKESVSHALGFCDNIALKDYMDFFIDNWGKFYFKKGSDFYIGSMRDDAPLKDFMSKYDYKSSFTKFTSKPKSGAIDTNKKQISTSDIEPVFLSGGDNLILEYGLILPINWLIKVKKFSEEKAVNYIASAFKRVYASGDWNKIIDKTNALCPYPEWFQVKDCKEFLLSEEDKKLKLSFNKDSNYNF